MAARRMFDETRAAALAWDSGQEDRENYEKHLEKVKKDRVKDHRSSNKIHKKINTTSRSKSKETQTPELAKQPNQGRSNSEEN